MCIVLGCNGIINFMGTKVYQCCRGFLVIGLQNKNCCFFSCSKEGDGNYCYHRSMRAHHRLRSVCLYKYNSKGEVADAASDEWTEGQSLWNWVFDVWEHFAFPVSRNEKKGKGQQKTCRRCQAITYTQQWLFFCPNCNFLNTSVG